MDYDYGGQHEMQDAVEAETGCDGGYIYPLPATRLSRSSSSTAANNSVLEEKIEEEITTTFPEGQQSLQECQQDVNTCDYFVELNLFDPPLCVQFPEVSQFERKYKI